MGDYFAFGGRLRSELEFPDLSPLTAGGDPDWEIRVVEESPSEAGDLQGRYEVQPGWVFHLYRHREGLRLQYGSSGSYDILADGRRIVWRPGADRRDELVRSVLIGPVMAIALHVSGHLCFHGSAVTLGGGGVAFLAPKGYGKSTLALSLVAGGGRLMSDDIVVVRRAAPPRLIPGVHSVRMFSDVSQRLIDRFPGATLREGWKRTLTELPRDRLGWDPAPLGAIYLLRPSTEMTDGERAYRRPLRAAKAVVELAGQTKLTDDLIGYEEAGRMLRWIADLAGDVPIYELHSPWSLERLPGLLDSIREWHPTEGE